MTRTEFWIEQEMSIDCMCWEMGDVNRWVGDMVREDIHKQTRVARDQDGMEVEIMNIIELMLVNR